MNRFLIAGVGLVLTVLQQSAAAADLRAPLIKAPVAAPAYNWSGFYAGGHAGYGWSDQSFTTAAADAATAAYWQIATAANGYDTAPKFDMDGWLGGLQLGYNNQVGRYVFGIEGDISWSGIDGGQNRIISSGLVADSTNISTSELGWLSTLRARLGFLPTDQVLVYATGGLAVGGVKHSYFVQFTDDIFAGNASKTEWGWTVGGGAEFAIAGNWTAKFEYLYYDLGDTDFQTVGSGTSTGRGTFNVTADNAGQIVRLGVNYRY